MRIVIIFLVLIFIMAGSFQAGSAENGKMAELYQKAAEDYQKANYTGARDKYEQIAASGLQNGYLFYNLGNVYSKLNKPGKAMLYYLRAEELIPADPGLKANLNFTRQKLAEPVKASGTNISGMIFFWNGYLNLEQQLIIFLGLWSFFCGLLLLKRFVYHDLIRTGALITGFITVIAGTALGFRAADVMALKAVVVSQVALIKSSTDANSITMFQVREGTVLKVTEQTDQWSKIELNKDMRGWIQSVSLENI